MLKTIKTTKHMRLDELIKYVWENNLYPNKFKSVGDFEVKFDDYGAIKFENDYIFNVNSSFVVEVEKEITKNTVFDLLIRLYEDLDVEGGYDTFTYYDKSVKYILGRDTNKHYPTKEIHALINGKLELVWESEEE